MSMETDGNLNENTCPYCKKSFPTLHAMRCHVSREKVKPQIKRCDKKALYDISLKPFNNKWKLQKKLIR